MKDTLPKMQLFGERVLFEPVEEEMTGSIVLPQKANKTYDMGRVLQIGDGVVKDRNGNLKKNEILVKPGDIVWFQVNAMMAANCAVRFSGKTYLNVIQGDLIARLKSTTVSLENFEVLGNWTLLDTFEDKTPNSQIVLPDNADGARMLRYYVVQKGTLATEINVGQEVIIEKRAAQLVSLNGNPFFYIDSRHIWGTVDDSPEKVKALADKADVAKALQKDIQISRLLTKK